MLRHLQVKIFANGRIVILNEGDEIEFEIEVENLPSGANDLYVDTAFRGGKKLPLDFEVEGQSVRIENSDDVAVLEGAVA